MNAEGLTDVVLYTTLENLAIYAAVRFVARIRRRRHPTAIFGLSASIATALCIPVGLMYYYDPSIRCQFLWDRLASVALAVADLCIGLHFYLKSRILNVIQKNAVVQVLLLLATAASTVLPLYAAAILGDPAHRKYHEPSGCAIAAVEELPLIVTAGQAASHSAVDALSLAAFAFPLYRMIRTRKEAGLQTALARDAGFCRSAALSLREGQPTLPTRMTSHETVRGPASGALVPGLAPEPGGSKVVMDRVTLESFGTKATSTADIYLSLVRRSVLATAASFFITVFLLVIFSLGIYNSSVIVPLEQLVRVLAALTALPLPPEQ